MFVEFRANDDIGPPLARDCGGGGGMDAAERAIRSFVKDGLIVEEFVGDPVPTNDIGDCWGLRGLDGPRPTSDRAREDGDADGDEAGVRYDETESQFEGRR